VRPSRWHASASFPCSPMVRSRYWGSSLPTTCVPPVTRINHNYRHALFLPLARRGALTGTRSFPDASVIGAVRVRAACFRPSQRTSRQLAPDKARFLGVKTHFILCGCKRNCLGLTIFPRQKGATSHLNLPQGMEGFPASAGTFRRRGESVVRSSQESIDSRIRCFRRAAASARTTRNRRHSGTLRRLGMLVGYSEDDLETQPAFQHSVRA
jgi:hypothetical protein